MIGKKIRNIRKSKNLTIVELSEKIDVTSGYISQIERDLISPSLAVLKRLAEALEIPMSSLFLETPEENVVEILKNERTKVKFGNINVELEFITPLANRGDKNSSLEAFLFKLNPKTWVSENTIINEARECIYVLSGAIDCHIGDKVYTVSKGDSICVPENNGHMIFNSLEEVSEALCIISPAIH
ncbi:MAG: helix-turn-helix domain-containing protein [Sedimentibacter sp.]|uniref:helix-turn-helix domain-containing protein n=1 Tax=Sedimentibacter sp. TaxID=1960295 RepID=UPI002980FCBB|nr:helix-turn-helix domain-containing protein [Sedimentibacter sp.]MDW5299165.1 helix-turn-helix domain-containing protein [Sedimentibacter sp.]